MPTYEYECQKCSDLFEVFQSMKDERIKKCPECGGKVKRLFGTGAGVIFKGSGFYETDYRSNTYHSDAKKDAPSSAVAASKESKKKSKETPKKNDKQKTSSSTTAPKKSK